MTYRVGLTGGIACGKSETQAILRERAVPVLDTDAVAHAILRKGSEVHDRIVSRFGPEVLSGEGEIDRKALGRIVFSDSGEREALNAIVHPEVGRRWRAWLEARREPLAVVAIPLLYECGLEHEFDGVVCVRASEALMMERLRDRGLTEVEARQRIRSQMPVEEKAARATWILDNNKTLNDLKQQVDRWLATINAQENH